MLLYPKGGVDKSNITGSYYTDITNKKDENNSCEIGYLDVIKNGKLNSDWGKAVLNINLQLEQISNA